MFIGIFAWKMEVADRGSQIEANCGIFTGSEDYPSNWKEIALGTP